jgi:aspartate/methionine/tyrosine aminotransferase
LRCGVATGDGARDSTELDPITKLFGSSDSASADGRLDIATGALRDIPDLVRLWDALTIDEVLASIGRYPGTQGPALCLDALTDLWRVELDHEVDPHCFVLTHGALDALGHAVGVLPEDGVVLFPEPGFGFHFAIERMGRRALPISWIPGDSVDEYIEKVRDILKTTSAPSAVIASFPSNPSGECGTVDDLLNLNALTEDFGTLLIVDDVYRFLHDASFVFDTESVIVVDSLSKRFGAPGLRCGYAMATGQRLQTIRASVARTSVGVGLPTAEIATHALRRYCADQSIRSSVLLELERRRADVRSSVPESVQPYLLLSEHGLYGCLLLPAGCDPDLLIARSSAKGVLITSSRSLQTCESAVSPPFVRFCVGSDGRVGHGVGVVARELEKMLAEQTSLNIA